MTIILRDFSEVDQLTNHARQPAQDGEQDVDDEVRIATCLQKHRNWGDENGEEVQKYITLDSGISAGRGWVLGVLHTVEEVGLLIVLVQAAYTWILVTGERVWYWVYEKIQKSQKPDRESSGALIYSLAYG